MSKYFESDTNITFSAVLSFVDDPGPQMQQLEEKDARIIIGSFQEDAARAVFCEVRSFTDPCIYLHGFNKPSTK